MTICIYVYRIVSRSQCISKLLKSFKAVKDNIYIWQYPRLFDLVLIVDSKTFCYKS